MTTVVMCVHVFPGEQGVSSSGGNYGLTDRVVPGLPFGQQAAGRRRTPAAPGIGPDRNNVTEHRIHYPPGGFDGVLPGEQPALPGQRGADETVVGQHVRAWPLVERKFLPLRLPAGPRLLADQGQPDLVGRMDPEAQAVWG